MRGFYLSAILLLSVTFAFSQEVRKEYYDEDEKQIKTESTFVGEKKEGLEKKYYENGTLAAELIYKNNKVEGLCKYYYQDGKIWYEKTFKNGMQNGPMKEYATEGTVLQEREYKNGNINGEAKSYTKDGKLKTVDIYKGGSKNGVSVQYFADGSKELETPYVGNIIEGVVKQYNEGGDLIAETAYKHGKKHGTSTGYFEKKPATVIEFKDGKQLSLKRLDEEGKPWMEKTFDKKEKRIPFKPLKADEAAKLPEVEKKEYDTKCALMQLRGVVKKNARALMTDGLKGIRKKIRAEFGGSMPSETIKDSSDLVTSFSGNGGFYFDRVNGDVFLNISGKDSKGVPYFEYPDTVITE